MPIVAEELGDLALYGWVYSAFFLGNLVGIVVAGGALDRMPLHRPFAVGLGLFAVGLLLGGLAPSMPILVAGAVHPGPGRRRGRAHGVHRDRPLPAGAPPAAHVRDAVHGLGRARDHRAEPRGGRRRARRAGAGCSWACCRCSWSRAASRSTRCAGSRAARPAAPSHEHGTGARLAPGDRRRRRCRAAGRGPRARPMPWSWSPASIVGVALLVPAFRWLTPRGHAAPRDRRPGRGDAARGHDLRLLLGRRLHPAAAPDVARHARPSSPASCSPRRPSPGRPARGSRRGASTATARGRFVALGFALVAIGAALTIPVVLPWRAAGDRGHHLDDPGPRHGLHVQRGDAGRAARAWARRPRGAPRPRSSSRTSSARRSARASRGAITAAGERAGPDGLGHGTGGGVRDVAGGEPAGARRRRAAWGPFLPADRAKPLR